MYNVLRISKKLQLGKAMLLTFLHDQKIIYNLVMYFNDNVIIILKV
jgi:hypothetical protein